ncbi:MAG TPA: universal stress protein [Miltoncostaeaceae bacterium]|nr:universal stress protein [Miltoncostaeaceae bacterium]
MGGRCLVFANAGPVDADAEQGQGRDRVVLLGPLEVEDEQEQQREAREAGTVLPEALAALTETPEGSLGWLGELARAGDYEYPVVLDQQFPPKAVCEWAAEVGPDLLVAAAVRRPGQRLLHGAFAGHLAYHAPCPVLLVH